MEKRVIIAKLVEFSSQADDMNLGVASDELLICAEKVQKDEDCCENLERAIDIVASVDYEMAQGMVREAVGFGFMDKMKGIGKGVWDAGKKKVQDVGKGIGQSVGQGVQNVKNVGKGIGQGVNKGLQNVQDFGRGVAQNVNQGINQGIQDVKDVGAKVGQGINAITANKYNGLIQAMKRDVNNSIARFQKNMDTGILMNEIEKIRSSYAALEQKEGAKMPPAIKKIFDSYLVQMKNFPAMAQQANNQAIGVMNNFVKTVQSTMQQLEADTEALDFNNASQQVDQSNIGGLPVTSSKKSKFVRIA